MIDSTVSISRVVSGILWAIVISLGVAAWSLGIGGLWHWSILVGLTGCGMSAAAATANIRCYALRLCAHIKAIRAGATVPTPRLPDDDSVRNLY